MQRALTRKLLLVILPVVAWGCSSKTATNRPAPLSPKEEWRAHHDAGKAAHARGDQETAEREFRKTLDVAAGERPPGLATAISLNALAVLYIDAGRPSEAAPMLDEATRIFEERGQTDDEFFAMVLTNRGDLAISQGRAVDAEREYRRSLAIGAVPKAVHDRAVRGVVASLCVQGRTEEAKQFGGELSIGCRNDRSPGSAQTETSSSTAAPDGGRGAVRNRSNEPSSAAAGEQPH